MLCRSSFSVLTYFCVREMRISRAFRMSQGSYSAAHVEHLQEALRGDVDTVLGPSLPLGDPDRALSGGDAFADILGQDLRGQVEFAGGDAADDLDHPVGADQALDRLALEEVVAHADLGEGQLVPEQDQLGEGGVEDDIAVVGHRQVLAFDGLELVDAVVGEVSDRLLDNPFRGLRHDQLLEVVHRADAAEDVPQVGFGLIGEDVLGNPGYIGMLGQFGKGGSRFFVVIGSYVLEWIQFVHGSSVLYGAKVRKTRQLIKRVPAGSCPRN